MGYKSKIAFKEVAFQVILYVLVFSFYSFERDSLKIEDYKLVFFLQYVLGTLFISYALLPRFFYKKKYIPFFIGVTLVVALIILIEEAVIEQIYFPDTRGRAFPGVFFSLFQVLPIITILTGFKFAWDAVMKQNQLEELEQMIQESELKMLKSQINPHFLFNNLNNLYSYAIEHSPKTPTIILELSSVLRYMLYECKEKYVLLSQEVKNLEHYVKLSELQIEERGKVHYQAKNIGNDYEIAPLILIVFVENAFKHSQSSQSENIFIDISMEISEEGFFEFRCKNNYADVSNTENLPHGIGLENVKKRLDLIYPEQYRLKFDKTDRFYEVCLSLKLKKQKQHELHHYRRPTTRPAYS